MNAEAVKQEPIDDWQRLKSLAEWIEKLHYACQKLEEEHDRRWAEVEEKRKLDQKKRFARLRGQRETLEDELSERGMDDDDIKKTIRRLGPGLNAGEGKAAKDLKDGVLGDPNDEP